MSPRHPEFLTLSVSQLYHSCREDPEWAGAYLGWRKVPCTVHLPELLKNLVLHKRGFLLPGFDFVPWLGDRQPLLVLWAPSTS